MPSVRGSESPLRSVEDEIVEALECALKTKWHDNGTPHVLEPADSHALSSYQTEVLTTIVCCLRGGLAAEVDRLRAFG
jgi:hypothetical protein